MLTLGQIGLLRVKEIGKIGAFLDWGLEKDLFLPYKEQTVQVRPGKSYLVALYIDKSKRLCATMRIYAVSYTHLHLATAHHWLNNYIIHYNIYFDKCFFKFF